MKETEPPKQQKSALPKVTSDRIGRSFNLLFTRAVMYHMEHPSTVQSLGDFYEALREGWNVFSPIDLIMSRERFYIEEEPLDPRINTAKMVSHFKKASIESVSFERGLTDAGLSVFIRVFTDLTSYPTSEPMKAALAKAGVGSVKINHVMFKKMTADDEVVSRDLFTRPGAGEWGTVDYGGLPGAGPGGPPSGAGGMDEAMLRMMAGSVVMEELEKSLSVQNLLESPTFFSQMLIDTDLSSAQGRQAEGLQPGRIVAHHIHSIREKVEGAEGGAEGVNMPALLEAVFSMRKNLLEGIEAQKAMGVIFADESKIREEVNELTDQVIIRLVKEEYREGKVSIPRLAQILRRLLPEQGELRRLLPKLKEALLAEGMPFAEFLQLIQELGRELQSDALVQVLQEGAEEIGLSADDLIREIKRDPSGIAELIALAAEIRKGTGDEKVLTDVLVDYVERIGSQMAMDSAEKKGEEGGKHLREVMASVEMDLIGRLRKKAFNDQVLNAVEQRLKEHMEAITKKLKSNWIMGRFSSVTPSAISKTAVLKMLDQTVEGDEERQALLEEVLSALRKRGMDEKALQRIAREIAEARTDEQKEREKGGLPKGTYNRGTTLFLLKREIAQAMRYNTPFSGMLLSLVSVSPKKSVPPGSIKPEEVKTVIMERLVKVVRDTDLVCSLDENMMLVLLAMTEENGAHIALERIQRALCANTIVVRDTPLEVKLAAVVTSFSRERTPTLKDFLTTIEADLKSRVKALKESA